MLPEDKTAYERLGRLLAQHRVGIAARYKNKNLFAAEREINRRMVWSVETGARGNYTPDTFRDIERAYMLVPGSLARTVAGGELEPLSAAAPAVPRAPRDPLAPANTPEGDPTDDAAAALFPGDTRHDRLIRNIWRHSDSWKERLDLIEVVDPKLAAALRDVRGQSEAGLRPALTLQMQCNEPDTLRLSGSHRTVPVRHP